MPQKAGLDVVVGAGADGVGPGPNDAIAIGGIKRIDPVAGVVRRVVGADVLEEPLVGIAHLAVVGAHPDELRVEVGKDAVAGLAGDQGF